MHLATAAKLAREEMQKHLDPSWTFAWNNRKRSFGICSYLKKQIQLSRPQTRVESEEHVLDTIRHEIAHAIAGPFAKHGPEWKKVAKRLGAVPSASSTGTVSNDDKPEPLWVMVLGEQIIKRYYRKPGKRTFSALPYTWLRSDPVGTKGKLEILPYASYKKVHKK